MDRWDTGFVDRYGHQGLLGQAEGSTSTTVTEWIGLRSQAFRDTIRYVGIHLAAFYRAAITTPCSPTPAS